jgi:hypothetical protein
MKVRATKMGTADLASGEVKPAYSLRKAVFHGSISSNEPVRA